MINISIIIPAYNASATIIQTLESVLSQTSPHWEIIIIDDGSSDDTIAIAHKYIEKDKRIRLFSQKNQGVSVARNTGIGHANFEWLLFLDADDWISPYYVEKTTNLITANSDLDAVHCGWVRVATDGTWLKEMYAPDSSDMFPVLAKTSPFAVHACIIKKSVAERVGMFDPSVKNCQDWDFWQRVARTGAKFGAVKEVLALYRMQSNSLSGDRLRFYTDALRMLMLGHSSDPRVLNPRPDYINGQPKKELPGLKLYLTSWFAGLLIGKEKDAKQLLKFCEDDREPNLDALTIAENIFETALVTHSLPLTAWCTLWPKIENYIIEFLTALELQSKSVGLAKSTLIFLQGMILQHTELDTPLKIGISQGIQFEVTEPIPDIYPMPNVERLYCKIKMEGGYLGKIELPVCSKLVSGWLIKDAIAANFAWQILGRFFEYNVYSEKKYHDTNEAPSEMHNRLGWKVFLQQLWEEQNWRPNNFKKEKNEIAILPSVKQKIKVIELSKKLPHIIITLKKFRVVITMGGVAMGIIDIPFKKLITAGTLKNEINKIGIELCRVCVREALIGKPLNEKTLLQERLAKAAALNAKKGDRITYIPEPILAMKATMLAYRDDIIGTSSGRRAMLPVKLRNELIDMAESGDEQIVASIISQEQPHYILYVPELIKFSNSSINLGNKIMTIEEIANYNISKKVTSTDKQKTIDVTGQLPILKYHHVIAEETSNLNHSKVTPELFEEQLRYFHDNNFYSVNWNDWINAMFKRTPLTGKAVAIIFDEGYSDFYKYAWPLLKKYGFTATVFLTTNAISQRSDYTAGLDGTELMGWEEILKLQKEGIQFGSNSATRRSLTALSPEEIVYEAAHSRKILQQKLKTPVKIFSYPFGHTDPVVSHLVGACGYTIGLTSKNALSTFIDEPMALPAVEIKEDDNVESFIKKLSKN